MIDASTGKAVDYDSSTGLPAGHYYLSGDVTGQLSISSGDVWLDLNGHELKGAVGAVIVIYGGTLNLVDSAGGGKITHNSEAGGLGVLVVGTFNMYGGTISGNTGDYSGGVQVGGTFTLYGGTITGNTANGGTGGSGSPTGGGGVCVRGGTFIMNGGVIFGNTSNATDGAANVYVDGGEYRGTFTWNGGTIKTGSADSTSGSPSIADLGIAGGGTITQNVTAANYISSAPTLFGNRDVTGGTTYYQLIADVTLTTVCYIYGTVYLDLNGHVLKRESNDADSREPDYRVIAMNSNGSTTLILTDSDPSNTHTGLPNGGVITGSRGGVYAISNSTFNMYGGTIYGNSMSGGYGEGGGVYMAGGTFTMYGGTISGNSTSGNHGYGGGVSSSGTFTMYGGTISDNTTSKTDGGGVYVKSGTFTMYGGTISGNKATDGDGGGVFVDTGGTLNLSGNPTISDNKKGSADNNVGLLEGTKITVAGALTNSTPIGVTMKTPGVFTSGWNDKMSTADPASYFTSDDASYTVALASNGEATLAALCTVTWMSQDGTETLRTDHVAGGSKPNYGNAEPTKTADAQYTYTFAGWATSVNQESGTATANLPDASGDVTYYAAFSKTTNSYTIKFVNQDGTELQSSSVAYGATPAYAGATPTMAADDDNIYTFSGWTPGITSVTGEATYTATYTSTDRTYTLALTAPTFDAVSVGYAQPAAKALTITSTGNSDATISAVALSGDGATSFTLNKTDGATVAAGTTDDTTYTVRPNADLEEGTYTATVTVTYNGTTATANVTFTVSDQPTYTVTVTTEDGGAASASPASGSENQTVAAGSAMTDVVYNANTGYFFPDGYNVSAVNGVKVTRNSASQITVSGTPTGVVTLSLPAPTQLDSISVSSSAHKTSYTVGDSLDVSGLVIALNDPAAATVNVTADMVSGFDSSTAGSKTLTITYDGKTTTYTVTINNAVTPSTPAYYGGDNASSTPAPAPATITVPVSGDANTVNVTVTISGTTATLRSADIKSALAGNEETGTVEIDVGGLDRDISAITIPAKTVSDIADAVASEDNATDSLTVKLTDGTVTFDAAAVEAITEQAEGRDLRLNLDGVETSAMSETQQAATADLEVEGVLDVYMTSGSTRITDFKGGSAEIRLPFTAPDGRTAAEYRVWYVAGDGALTDQRARYDTSDRCFVFTVKHFSNYIVAYSGCPQDETCPISAFIDVDPTAWYHDGVHYVLENGIMSGYGDGLFGPNDVTNRAMMAQILWNMEGKPVVNYALRFVDVDADMWYGEAVRWATAEGIVNGYGDDLFGPDDAMTREQLAAIVHRYAKYKGVDVSIGEDTNILSYDDAFDVSEWAIPAMQWAVGSGAVGGRTDTTLNPKDNATRAEIATMMVSVNSGGG